MATDNPGKGKRDGTSALFISGKPGGNVSQHRGMGELDERPNLGASDFRLGQARAERAGQPRGEGDEHATLASLKAAQGRVATGTHRLTSKTFSPPAGTGK